MFDTAVTFSLTQFARSLSLPERIHSRPFRNAALEPWRLRNATLDALFYDIKALTTDETFYISDCLAAEGAIMIVPPTGKGMLTLCETVEEYRLRGGKRVHTLAVAGMGGSACGAAAFARNVADAVGEPVAAVVSGYGLGDLLAESMGAGFFFGPLGFLRQNFDMIDDVIGRPKFGDYSRRLSHDGPAACSTGLDTDTVEALLRDKDLSFTLAVGHSRGSMTIAEALFALDRSDPERLEEIADRLRLVSFGTCVTLPAVVSTPNAILGELDWFGEMNATGASEHTQRIARSGHGTNTEIPGALKVTELLRNLLQQQGTTRKASPSDPAPQAAEAEASPKAEDAPSSATPEHGMTDNQSPSGDARHDNVVSLPAAHNAALPGHVQTEPAPVKDDREQDALTIAPESVMKETPAKASTEDHEAAKTEPEAAIAETPPSTAARPAPAARPGPRRRNGPRKRH
ncbi:cell envelope biogenesis protein OmpA [Allorhizobium sp. BGMRC 0089]|uniref:cell envelope biogenesis protein OmpA n=1 Tax=Allorhizobium sonneratiae TaxID=2934936 RepID=UPI0020343670|nr:cell envelope biogenesis protein OmpA [Allorhizobium sonneratiae]MCM2291205.1 cell envelope biogenesis protein OmpA [Allorhizobium sonneratiae]